MLALTLIVGVYLWQRTAMPLWVVDLFCNHYAAYEWKHGEPEWIYTTLEHYPQWVEHRAPIAEMLQADGTPNQPYYPPFLALILSPVADYSAIAWRNVLFVINILLLFVFAHLLIRACDANLSWRSFLWSLALVLCTYPMARATKLGQIVPIQAAMVWFGLLALRDRRESRAGILLGAMGALKVFPLAFLMIAAVIQRYRTVVVAVAVTVSVYVLSLLLMGFSIHASWFEAVREVGEYAWVFFGNQSLTGWFLRLFTDFDIWHDPAVAGPWIVMSKWTIAVLLGGSSLWLMWSRRSHIVRDGLVPASGLWIAAILLAIPTSWEHYWMYVLPVLGWAIHSAWVEGDSRWRNILLGTAVFLFTMKLTRFYGNDLAGRIVSGSQSLGMLLLWGWLFGKLRSKSSS